MGDFVTLDVMINDIILVLNLDRLNHKVPLVKCVKRDCYCEKMKAIHGIICMCTLYVMKEMYQFKCLGI